MMYIKSNKWYNSINSKWGSTSTTPPTCRGGKMETKKCSKCKKIKPITEFTKNKASADGLKYKCRKCSQKDFNAWKDKNPGKYKKILKRYYENNHEKIKEYRNEYRLKNKEYFEEYSKEWFKNNPQKVTAYRKKTYKKHAQKRREEKKEWRLNNPLKQKLLARKSYKKRMTNPTNKLSLYFSTSMWESLKGKKNNRNWESLVNYTVEDLKKHLENQFKPGMTWNNYSRHGWHIDHIIPKSWFEFNSYKDREFKQCYSLANLQPLWAKENISKGNRVPIK